MQCHSHRIPNPCMLDESLSTGRVIGFTILSFHSVKRDGRLVKHSRCNVPPIIPAQWAVCMNRSDPIHLVQDCHLEVHP